MPTVPTHALVATTLFAWWWRRGWNWKVLFADIMCAMLPDADVVGFSLGVRYGDLLGHRGLSHSLPFAAGFRRHRDAVWCFLFACAASHGILDAATDGGLGVAFLSPFSNERYFWPWRPIRVSPISLTRFFSGRGTEVITTELAWIWLPCAIVLIAVYRVHDQRRNRRTRRET